MGLARSALLRASENGWLRERVPRLALARRMVRRFMPGETPESALAATGELNAAGVGTVLTCLGEYVASPAAADAVARHYEEVAAAPPPADFELSVKPTHLGLGLGQAACAERVARIAAACARSSRTLWVDMESSATTDATLEIYADLRRVHPNLGVCLQANLRRTPSDVERLLPLAPAIRLVKGAYAEPGDRAYTGRAAIDEAFRALALALIRAEPAGEDGGSGDEPGAATLPGGRLRPVLGTHDVGLVERIRAQSGGRPLEVHMLYGIRTSAQAALAADPRTRLRVLISYGAAWYPWFVRRLAERPANLLLALR
jgi:proline dehydrogenase